MITWQPPTAKSLYKVYRTTRETYSSSDEDNFPFLYDHQVAEEDEQFEVLPGLFGKVDNYYVTHPGSPWYSSQVWINNREFIDWYRKQDVEQ